VSIAWPRLIFSNEFESANDAAVEVRAYYEAKPRHPGLPLSPFDWFTRALFFARAAGPAPARRPTGL